MTIISENQTNYSKEISQLSISNPNFSSHSELVETNAKIYELSQSIYEFKVDGENKANGEDVDNYSTLSKKYMSIISKVQFSNCELDSSPPPILEAFIHRLSLSRVLLLDFAPYNKLFRRQHAGATSYFLGGYVAYNYSKSDIFRLFLSTIINSKFREFMKTVNERFKNLLKGFKYLSSCYELLVNSTTRNSYLEIEKLYEETILQSIECSNEIVLPLTVKTELNNYNIAHLMLLYIDCYNKQFHIINTFPNDEQGYRKTSDESYEQNCSISVQASEVNTIVSNVMEATRISYYSDQKPPSDIIERENIGYFTEKCISSVIGENEVIDTPKNTLSKMKLKFGEGCSITTYHTLFQTLLSKSVNHSSMSMLKNIKVLSDLWFFFLKVYVLSNFQSEVMTFGKNTFDDICVQLKTFLNTMPKNVSEFIDEEKLNQILSNVIDEYIPG